MQQVPRASNLEDMVARQIAARGITDQRVLSAFRAVPRERFVPEELEPEAFSDQALPLAKGQTISQPYIVALMTLHLSVGPDHRVLEIGTGSGYQAAILSKLAREVWSIERHKELLDRAFEALGTIQARNVHLRHGDGTLGWPEAAPFDRILLTAAPPGIPTRFLLQNLVEGGIGVLPAGPDRDQRLYRVEKVAGTLQVQPIMGVRFVPLVCPPGWVEG